MLVPSLTFLNHFIVTKLSKSRTPLQDGLLALVLKVSFIVHLRERSLSCDSNFGILAKQSRQFTALSESETSLKAHVFSKKSRHSLDISRNGTRKNCIRSTHYIPSSRAGIHPFYLANDCTFFLLTSALSTGETPWLDLKSRTTESLDRSPFQYGGPNWFD